MISIKDIFTKENILAAISVLAFIMSSLTWIFNLLEKRKNLFCEFDLTDRLNTSCLGGNLYATCAFLFENKSRKPISITRIVLTFENGKTYSSEMEPGFVAHNFRKLIDTTTPFYERFIESTDFPINLVGLESRREYVKFCLPAERMELSDITIQTNCGKVKITDEDAVQEFGEFLLQAFQNRQETIDSPVTTPDNRL